MNRLFISFAAIVSVSVNASIFDNETCAIVKAATKQEATAIITSAITARYVEIYEPQFDEKHLEVVNEYLNKTLVNNVYNTCLIDEYENEMLVEIIDTYIKQKEMKLDIAKEKFKETFEYK